MSVGARVEQLGAELDALREAGTYKRFNTLCSPQGPVVEMEGRGEVLVLSSNNYLGLAEPAGGGRGRDRGAAPVRRGDRVGALHLRDVRAAPRARARARRLRRHRGVAHVRLVLERERGLRSRRSPTTRTVILSDELNHASIIDAIRLAKPARKAVYKHSDMDDLRAQLESLETGQRALVISDGVFSMEGDLAKLPEIVELAREHDATLVVDDSHGTGVLGETGRGMAEHFGVLGEVDVITSTLGKALGGAAGGFVAASEEVCDILAQRSRPQLFSNALPPTVACSALAAVRVLRREPELVAKLHRQTAVLPRPAARDRLQAARRRRGDRPDHRRRDRVRDPLQRAAARGGRLRHGLRLPGRAGGHGARARARCPRRSRRSTSTGRWSVREGRKGAGAAV